MATVPSHQQLHSSLRKALGPAPGDAMIDLLAPLERDDLARRSDVEALGTRLDARIDRLDAKIDRLDGQIKAEISKLLYVLVPIMVSLAALVFVAVKI